MFLRKFFLILTTLNLNKQVYFYIEKPIKKKETDFQEKIFESLKNYSIKKEFHNILEDNEIYKKKNIFLCLVCLLLIFILGKTRLLLSEKIKKNYIKNLVSLIAAKKQQETRQEKNMQTETALKDVLDILAQEQKSFFRKYLFFDKTKFKNINTNQNTNNNTEQAQKAEFSLDEELLGLLDIKKKEKDLFVSELEKDFLKINNYLFFFFMLFFYFIDTLIHQIIFSLRGTIFFFLIITDCNYVEDLFFSSNNLHFFLNSIFCLYGFFFYRKVFYEFLKQKKQKKTEYIIGIFCFVAKYSKFIFFIKNLFFSLNFFGNNNFYLIYSTFIQFHLFQKIIYLFFLVLEIGFSIVDKANGFQEEYLEKKIPQKITQRMRKEQAEGKDPWAE